jgi:hypothetical protein
MNRKTKAAKKRVARKPAVKKTAPKNAAPAGDDRWWALIERARQGTAHPEATTEILVELLERDCTAEEILAFDTFVQERLRDAFRWDLWGIAYIMSGGCSDDGFDYFCGWLVGMGKAHYSAALAHPAAAANGVSPDDEPFENEAMWYAASRAWQAKTGKTSEEFYATTTRVVRRLHGEAFDEDTVREQHPELVNRFG